MHSKYPLSRYWLLICSFCFLAANLFFNKTLFNITGSENVDGFYSQITYILECLDNGEFISTTIDEPLFFVHFIRLLAVAPFLLIEELGWPPIVESAWLLLLLWPLVSAKFIRKQALAYPLLLSVPYVLSFRGVLVGISIGYIFLIVSSPVKRKRLLFLVSAIFANLSSAAMIAWLLIVFLCFGILRRRRLRSSLPAVITFQIISLLFSFSDKIQGFLAGADGYQGYPEAGDNLLMVVISRSTIFSSIVEGQYVRAVGYAVALAFVLAAFVIIMTRKGHAISIYRKFFLCVAPTFLLEGLGMVAFVYIFICFMLGVRPEAPMPLKRQLQRTPAKPA